jgi:hypothetical protein
MRSTGSPNRALCPHEIGKDDFRAERLALQGGVLVMTRTDLELQLHFKLVESLDFPDLRVTCSGISGRHRPTSHLDCYLTKLAHRL